MTVKELKEELALYDEDGEVIFDVDCDFGKAVNYEENPNTIHSDF